MLMGSTGSQDPGNMTWTVCRRTGGKVRSCSRVVSHVFRCCIRDHSHFVQLDVRFLQVFGRAGSVSDDFSLFFGIRGRVTGRCGRGSQARCKGQLFQHCFRLQSVTDYDSRIYTHARRQGCSAGLGVHYQSLAAGKRRRNRSKRILPLVPL